jgi:UDP-glucose 4-epimerase
MSGPLGSTIHVASMSVKPQGQFSIVSYCIAMTTSVVGGAGFLGRTLVELMRDQGEQTQVFTRGHPCLAAEGHLAAGFAESDCVIWLATGLNPLIAEQQPELVTHEYRFLERVLQHVAREAPLVRFVYVSSGGTVYGADADPPYSEAHATVPTGSYGKAKLACEQLVADNLAGACVARVSNVYGPGQPVGRGQGVVAHWLRAARRGERIQMYGDPRVARDFVYVRDVAKALVVIKDARKPPPTVNVGSGVPTSLGELAEHVLAVVGDPALEIDVIPSRSFDIQRTWLDVSLMSRELGWTSQTTLREGLAVSWRAVRTLGEPGE